MVKSFKVTTIACYIGYIVQALIVNFLPLLYVQITDQFSISIERVTWLITVTFGLQLFIDAVAPKIIDKLGYRPCIIFAHLASSLGFILLSVLPFVMDAFTGIFISVIIYATGSGLIEVMISPIIEACPSSNKAGRMQLLHSFYCWGMVLVVLLTTAFFAAFGIDNWRYCALCWAALPLLNTVLFAVCPINVLVEREDRIPARKLLSKKTVWVIFILMACAGAAEVAVSQWISAFVEEGLNISKEYSDLLGPCAFAACMGIVRVVYGFVSERINLKNTLIASGVLCVIAYLIIIVSPWPWLSLVGAGLCGVSVSIMWPGLLSLGSAAIPDGGTNLFAYMALTGDLGCIIGPGLVGFIAGNTSLQTGLGFGIIFPVLMIVTLFFFKTKKAVNA